MQRMWALDVDIEGFAFENMEPSCLRTLFLTEERLKVQLRL